jgi:CBS domain containing-hemolysin-like protein
MSELLSFLLIIFCILLESFFSGSETAIVSVSKIKLRHLARTGSRRALMIQKLFSNPARLLSTTLVGTNLCTVTATALATSVMIRYWGSRGDVFAILFLFPLTLICGEVLPKSYYHTHRHDITLKVAYPLKVFSILFQPVVLFLNACVGLILHALGAEKRPENLFVTKEEMHALVEMDKKHEILEPLEQDMIDRIFDFGDTTAKEVLVPLIDVEALERNVGINEVLEKVETEGYSRYPVYYERIDNIIGTLNVFDLIDATGRETDITRFIRPAYYIPETMRIDDLLSQMQKEGHRIAIVVDEYGNSEGIVTLEDLLEEIVGEIRDEYDETKEMYQFLGDQSYLVDARMEVDEIERLLDLDLPEGDYETLGGMILQVLERIPDPGEKIELDKLEFRILKADGRSIKKVVVRRIPKQS